ncbi:MAG: helix-turn-helix transcriptional regulator [Spirochaetes bacterium]|nr:helix-turn-helix transcriptional regulator [Spirochaetota bacterium]
MARLHVHAGAAELAGPHVHGHPIWELHYFMHGTGAFRQRGVDQPISEGSCFLSAPAEAHDILPGPPISLPQRGAPGVAAAAGSRRQKRLGFYYARFRIEEGEEALLQALHRQGFGQGGVVLEPHHSFAFEEILYKYHTGSPALLKASAHLLHAFLYSLSAPRGLSASRAPSPVRHAQRLMESQLDRPFSLDRLSAAVGWERSYLVRRFKKATGFTPLVYFQRLKVERAAFLLRATNMDLDELAESLGFCDRFRFSKVFCKYAGVPPVRYRKSRNQKPIPP